MHILQMEVSISAYVYIFICVLYVCKNIFVYIYVYMYSASSLWYIHYIYIVFIRTLSFTFTPALLLTNSSAISIRPFLAAQIRAVRTFYDIDIVKEESILNTSYINRIL